MSAGLFGKLPAKRDFVGANASAPISRGLGAVASGGRRDVEADAGAAVDRSLQSRADLALLAGRRFLRRGDDRRVHAVGRRRRPIVSRSPFSPAKAKSLLRRRNSTRTIEWCEAAEAILLDALEPGATLGGDRRQSRDDAAPALQASIERDRRLAGTAGRRRGGARCRSARFRWRFSPPDGSAIAALSPRSRFWWTIGGEGFPPLALSEVGLPPATRFADMLTGAFADTEATAFGEAT